MAIQALTQILRFERWLMNQPLAVHLARERLAYLEGTRRFMYQQSYHIPGLLTADLVVQARMPAAASLVHVSAAALEAGDAVLRIGSPHDREAHMPGVHLGGGSQPVELRRGHFTGRQHPRLESGETLVVRLEHDGGGGEPAQDVTIVLTFVE
jgi:hypothetical protein